jgi:hypothetical protein
MMEYALRRLVTMTTDTFEGVLRRALTDDGGTDSGPDDGPGNGGGGGVAV